MFKLISTVVFTNLYFSMYYYTVNKTEVVKYITYQISSLLSRNGEVTFLAVTDAVNLALFQWL